MAGFNYARMQATADRLMTRFKQGAVLLTRTTIATGDPDTPWIPGAPTTDVYELRATAKGVSADLVDGTLIVATDLELTLGPKAVHTLTDGDPADGAEVEVEVDAADVISIDGRAATVLRVIRLPAAGTLVAWRVVVRV